jgi:hypothetical protein
VKEEFKRQLCLELVLRRYHGVIAVWLRQRGASYRSSFTGFNNSLARFATCRPSRLVFSPFWLNALETQLTENDFF